MSIELQIQPPNEPAQAGSQHGVFAGGVSSRLVRKFWSDDTAGCPRCNLMPLQYKAGQWKDGVGWITGKMWFQCPGCGMRGRKSESHEESARLWNERVGENDAKLRDAGESGVEQH